MDEALSSLHYPRCDQVTLTGRLSARYQGNLRYLAHIYETREDWMLEPFLHRGKEWVLEPLRNKKGELAWAGEYAGKWLDAAALSASNSGDAHLGQDAARFASELIATQELDGYLGIELPARRGQGSDWDWDVWNVKYAMTGLLTYFETRQDEASLHVRGPVRGMAHQPVRYGVSRRSSFLQLYDEWRVECSCPRSACPSLPLYRRAKVFRVR